MRTPKKRSVRRPLASSLARFHSSAAICAALAVATGVGVRAATYYWDADGDVTNNDPVAGANLGGSGTWTIPTSVTPTKLWFDATNPAEDIVWPNLTPGADTAVFAGTGGAVALGSPVVANALQFNSNGYSINNGGVVANALLLSGSTPTITVTNSTDTAVISAVIAGADGLTKTGNGTLTLGGGASDANANLITGTLTLNGGTLRLDKAAGTLATGSTNLQLKAGTVFFGSNSNLLASNQLASNADVTIDGATLNFHAGTGVSAASQTLKNLTINSGAINTTTGTFTDVNGLNTITVTDTFTVNGGSPTINSGTTFNAGAFVMSGGTLVIGGNTVLKKTTFAPGAVTLNGGTITMNTGTNTGAQRGEFVLSSDVIVGGTAATSISRGGTGTTSDPAIVLNDPGRVFNVADSTNSSASDLTIGVRLENGGIVKTGAGTLQLNITGSPFAGNIEIQQGTLAFIGSGQSVDPTALGTGSKTITLTNNATLALVTADADPSVAGGKGFIIGNGGGTFDIASGRTFFLNDGVANGSVQNQLQGSGTLTKVGAGIFNAGRDFSATFTGNVNLNLGRIDMAASGALGNVGTVTVDGSLGAARLNVTSTTAFSIVNDLVLQNGGVLSITGASHTLANSKSITIGAGAPRIRVDDGAAATVSATARTFVLNGAFNGAAGNTVEVSGPSGATRGILALSNTQSNFAGTFIIDKNASLENHARFNGTTAATTGKTIGTALIKFQALANGSGSTTDGLLDLRDNGTGNNQVFNYGNHVDMSSTGGSIVVGNGVVGASPVSTGGRFVLGNLTLGSGNTITVTNANNYSLEFGGLTTLAGDATFANTADLTLSGGITGGQNLVKNNAGRLTIGAPAGLTYTGSTTINAGSVVFNSAAAIGGIGQSVTVAAGALVGAGFSATQANFIDRLVPTANSIGVALGADTASNLNLSNFSGARLGAINTANFSGTLTVASSSYLLGGGGGTLVFTNANALTGSRGIDLGASGGTTGIVALDAANDFTGAIVLNGGLLRPASNSSLGNLANAITGAGGGIQLKAGAGFDIFAARTVTFAAGGFTLDTNGNDLTASVAIGNGGAGSFTKTGNGKLTLSQASTYTGATIITGGALSVSADNMFGAVPGSNTANQLQIQSGGTLEANGTFTIPTQRGVQLTNGGGTISVTDGNTLTLASNTSGNGQLIKDGAGTLLITTDPNSSGGFVVNGGVLALQHSGTTDGNIVVNSSGTLSVRTGNDLGDGFSVTVNSGGAFDLRAGDTISQLLGSGVVRNDGTAAATLGVNSATNATFSGVIQNGANASATLGFTKGGANTVTFTGANTYTGATQINTGVLAVQGAAGALGNTAITVGDNNGGDETLGFGQAADVWTGGDLNRIGDTGSITMNGRVKVSYAGPAAGSSGFTEALGAITTGAGANVFSLTPGTGAEVQLSPTSFGRSAGVNGTVLVRGDNLGGTGAGSSRIAPTGALTLVGGGGAAGGAQISILPWAVGDNSSTGAGASFVTTGANGLRILTDGEYASTIAGPGASRNVSLAGGETVDASASVNALRVTGGVTSIGAGATVSDVSGAVLFTGAGEIGGSGTLAFGYNEGVVHVTQNTTAVTAAINANITGSNGLTVGSFGFDGSGNYLPNTLTLGGSNSFAGPLTVNSGILRLAGAGAVNAAGVNTLVLRPGSTLQTSGNSFIFRDITSSGGSVLQNASANASTVTAFNVNSTTFAGVITDGAGGGALSLVKRGSATLTLNTGNSNFSGTTTVERGALTLNGSGRLTSNGSDGSTAFSVSGGGVLRLTNSSGGSTSTDRLRNTASITLSNGVFDFDNNASSGTSYSETTGALTIAGGANTVTSDQAVSGQASTLTFASLTRTPGTQSTVNFTSQANGGTVSAIGVDNRDRIVFTTAPTPEDGIIGGWAFINGTDFATYNSSGTISVAVAATTADPETAWDTTKNIKPVGSVTLTDNRTVNTLNFASGQSLDLGGKTLNIDAGGLIHQTSVATDTISNGTLTAGAAAGADLIIRTSNASGSLTVSSVITDNASGAVGLIKSGPGRLVLTGANTYSGPTSINGVLSISSDSALGAVPAAATPANIRIVDGGTLETTGSVTLDAKRGIELSGAMPTISATGGTLTYNGAFTIAGNTANTDLTLLGSIAFGGNVDTIGGGLNVGTNLVAGATASSSVTFAPASARLTIGANAPLTAELNIGYRTVVPTNDVASASTVGVLDLQTMESFSASLSVLRLGVITNGSNAPSKGDLLLPLDSAISVASGVVIGDSTAAGNAGQQSSLRFGSGVSTLTTTSIITGGRKGNGLLSVATGGRLTLKGFSPNSADLLVAYNNQDNTGVTSAGLADFSAGTFIGDLDELVVGFKTGSGGGTGGANGTVLLGASNNNVVANQIRLGDYSGTTSGTVSGTLTVGGGSVAVNSDVSLGLYAGNGTTGAAAGTLNVNGGSVRVEGNIVTTNSTRATATLNLNGGTLDMTGGTIAVDAFNAQSGVLRDVKQIFGGDGSTPAALTKTGNGVLEIQGANTFTGGTNVNAGTVLVNGSITGSVAVAAGATFGGNGSVNGPVAVATGGILSPGNGPGKLDVNGAISLASDTTLNIELKGLTPGSGYDQLNMLSATDSVSLGSNVTLNFTLGFHVDTSFDTFYYILTRSDAGTDYGATFAGLPEGAIVDLGGGILGKLTYHANWTGNAATSSFTGGNDIALSIPEPGSFTMLAGGLGALLGLGRFRRRSVKA